jgi:hypothetical protein
MDSSRDRYPERRERRARSIDSFYSNDEGFVFVNEFNFYFIKPFLVTCSDNREPYYNQKPNNNIIIRGLAQHITEADVSISIYNVFFFHLLLLFQYIPMTLIMHLKWPSWHVK